MDHRKKQYVQSLGLIPFPQEGGYFKETNDSIAKQSSNARARWQRAECVHYFYDHGWFPDLFEASSNYYKARDGINEGHQRGERLYTRFELWLCDLFPTYKGNKYESHNPSLQADNPHLFLHWRGFLNGLDQTCTEGKCPYFLPLLCFQHSMLVLVALTRFSVF